jgi:phosphate transport system substrate-binding protein
MNHRAGVLLSQVSLVVGIFGLVSLLTPSLEAQTIKIGGTGGALGTIGVLAEAFKKSHPEAKVIVVPGLGSGGARKALLGGAIDIAVTSKAGKDTEKLDGAVAALLGRTPFVFTTSKKNPADALTTQELVDIWNGKATAWPDGSRLRLILRPENDSDTDALKRISPALDKAVKSALSREGMKIAITDAESADAVEAIRGALGTSTLALLISEKRPLKALSLNGVTPSPKTIANGSYPLFKSIYVVTAAKPSELTAEFMRFLRSPSGREIVAQLGHWLGDASP